MSGSLSHLSLVDVIVSSSQCATLSGMNHQAKSQILTQTGQAISRIRASKTASTKSAWQLMVMNSGFQLRGSRPVQLVPQTRKLISLSFPCVAAHVVMLGCNDDVIDRILRR